MLFIVKERTARPALKATHSKQTHQDSLMASFTINMREKHTKLSDTVMTKRQEENCGYYFKQAEVRELNNENVHGSNSRSKLTYGLHFTITVPKVCENRDQ